MTEDIKLLLYAGVVFLTGMVFSFAYWLEENVHRVIGEERTRVLIEGVSHTLVGAFVGVVIFIALNELNHTFSTLLDGVIAIAGAVMVDTIIQIVKVKSKEL